ncbi:hypothetical protein ACQEU3_20700 [Spirillospora sp. CA-253888]
MVLILSIVLVVLVLVAGGGGYAYLASISEGDYAKAPTACSLADPDDPSLRELVPPRKEAGGTVVTPPSSEGAMGSCTWRPPGGAMPMLAVNMVAHRKKGTTSAEDVAHQAMMRVKDRRPPTRPGWAETRVTSKSGYGDEALLVEEPAVRVEGETFMRFVLHVRRSNLVIQIDYALGYPNAPRAQLHQFQQNYRQAALKAANLVMAKLPSRA